MICTNVMFYVRCQERKRLPPLFPLSLPNTAPAHTDHVDILWCGDVEWCKEVFGVNNIPV